MSHVSASLRGMILLFVIFSFEVKAGEKPNFVLVLADDMGYSDLSCFGSEISTPHFDSLAEGGVRLTRCRNAGMCVVSRASLLTGKWWPAALPEFQKTEILPELLKKQSYRTALIGKWHLKGHPLDRGFDHFFGFLNGFTDHFEGSPSYRLDREPFRDFGPDYYSSDAFVDRALAFINRRSDDPFFVFLSFQAPHNPLQAPREDIMKHRGKYLDGWQAVREARFARQQELGIFPDEAKLPSAPENLPDWKTLTPAQRDLEDLRMATYAAMIERMDHGMGRLIQGLKKLGAFENTLILVLSDNGTDPFSVVDQPMLKKGLLPGDRRSNWQPGMGWAYASVTPWRLYKISQHNGGVTTGGIVHWPKGISLKNQTVNYPVHFVDFLPTLVKAAGSHQERDGQSFLQVLQGEPNPSIGASYYQYMDHRAIRTERYTLVESDGSGWELFDHQRDPFETKDLSKERPKIVEKLDGQWNDWWRRSHNKPYVAKSTRESPHYKPQGDRGSGAVYRPTAMPERLKGRYPLPSRTE